ncbi:glycosyltransferase [Candidatus Woesearchaeota archaeon]|nr:glycosyltransferase [Candidatus Woesearchaeota archaeon]
MNATAIVPCYNEERTVGNVLKVLTTSPEIRKVIVVNDGSTDGSEAIIKQFNVQLISNRKNAGKGESVRMALAHVTTKFVLMCDADLNGLRHDSVAALLDPLKKNPNIMTIGLRDKDWHFGSKVLKKKLMILLLSGERALPTRHLRAVCADPRSAKYGLEAVLNFYCRRNGVRTVKVDLEGVRDTSKLQKQGKGLRPYIEGLTNVAETYAKLYFEDTRRVIGKLKKLRDIVRLQP